MEEFSRLKHDQGWDVACCAEIREGVWYTRAARDISFPDTALDDLYVVEDESCWFSYRNRVIQACVRDVGPPQALWEIGAGNGCVAMHLQRQGIPVVAIEPLASGAINARHRGLEAVICGRLEALRLPSAAIPAFGCFDVLEHLEEPAKLLAEVARCLVPGGLVIVSVPALDWLWSDADVVSGHFRRYTRRSLTELFRNTGFSPVICRYFMMPLVAPMLCLRTVPSLARRHRPPPEALERCHRQMHATGKGIGGFLLERALQTEFVISRFVPIPIGTSLVGVFRHTG